ncbi:Ferric reductase like transmembrane component [Amycolatopsis arida]|uniref:Ferric reductase like transmembrane component n=1 Tax=Amycolatopsis arida TaxID=587909 RepID=A0A1I6AQN3_9PSEU|nr:ferric reductase-like transmembrane domain-containing protein [Amycolatopsis arida]TDX97608.1 ferric reductase like protein [Amycolatopsis arida]SFQ71013.1 Ferric reductase like transmembrane component [Amycolatopsis arida]
MVADVPVEKVPAARRRGRRPPAFDWDGLRDDLRAAVPDATAALVVTGLIFWWLYSRIDSGVSATLVVMPFLADADAYWMYWLCQAFGWSGLLWAWATTMLGLVRSSAGSRVLRISAARVERWHRSTSLTTIALMFLHAVMFFAELVRGNENGLGWPGRVGTALVDTFVPGGYSSGTGRVAILLGLLALYLAIPFGLAFYLRARTGSRRWRALHRFVIVVYVLSVWHTLLYGTNVWFNGWPRTTLWALQLPVAVLLLVRLLAPARRAERLRASAPVGLPTVRRAAALVGAVVVIGALLVVIVSGRDGGRTPGVDGAGLTVMPWMVWTATGMLGVLVVLALYLVTRAERRAR